MQKKLLPLIGIALVVASISTAIFYSLFAGRLSGAGTAGGSQELVVVAVRSLKPGTVIGEGDVTLSPWGGPKTPPGAYSSAAAVKGKTVADTITEGEPVLAARLEGTGGSGSVVPRGMRAISIHASDSSGIIGMLKPGASIDVQVFSPRTDNNRAIRLTTLLRGVAVLSVSPQPEQSSQGYFAAPVVTLLVPESEAPRLAEADSYSRLRIALRAPGEPVEPASEAEAKTVTFRIRSFDIAAGTWEELSKQWRERPSGTPSLRVYAVPPEADDPSGITRDSATLVARGTKTAWADLGEWSGARLRIGLALNGGGTSLRLMRELVIGGTHERQTRSSEGSIDFVPGCKLAITSADINTSNGTRRILFLSAGGVGAELAKRRD